MFKFINTQEAIFEKYYNQTGIQLTTEPNVNSEYLMDKIETLHDESQLNPKKAIPKLIKAIRAHPDIPSFKNFLYGAYMIRGNAEKANEILHKTLEKHPKYVFAIHNKMINIQDKEELLKLGYLLGDPRDVREFEKYDQTIHYSTFICYQQVAGHFEAYIGDDNAVQRLESLIEVEAPTHMQNRLARTISKCRLKAFGDSMKAKNEIRIEGVQKVYLNQKWDERPKLYHQELNILYQVSISELSEQDRNSIMALPRQSLIADLEQIMLDATMRWHHFKELDWDESTQDFVLHALYFLGALKAEESLYKVLDLLRMGEEFIDFWFSDNFSELIYPTLYALGENQLDELAQFVLEEDIRALDKNIVNTISAQVALQQPNRRAEVIQWFSKVFEYYFLNQQSANLFDTLFLNFLIWSISDFRGFELLSYIDKVNQNQWIDQSIQGDFDKIKERLFKEQCPSKIKPVPLNIHEYYTNAYNDRMIYPKASKENLEIAEKLKSKAEQLILNNWLGLIDSNMDVKPGVMYHDNEEDHQDYQPANTIKNDLPKIGRNEPCSCGSGKKYKRCCWKKLNQK